MESSFNHIKWYMTILFKHHVLNNGSKLFIHHLTITTYKSILIYLQQSTFEHSVWKGRNGTQYLSTVISTLYEKYTYNYLDSWNVADIFVKADDCKQHLVYSS